MKRTITFAARLIPYAFVLLFIYAAVSKLMDFENFRVQLAQSPLLGAYAGVVSYGVIALELVTVALLLIPQTRKAALYASFGLMVAFTVYIYLILNYSDFVPCSCGGILEKPGWKEHLVFNIIMVGLACTALLCAETKRAALTTTAYLLTGAAISSAVMVALFLSSEYIIKKENNFTRRFPHHPVIEDKSFDLKVNSYYFAGISGNDIYLGNPSSPFRIFKMNANFSKLDTINIIPGSNPRFHNLRYLVQDKMLYAYDGSVPVIYASSIESTQKPLKEISRNDLYFDQLVAVSPALFILRVEEKSTNKTALARLSIQHKHQVKINNSLLTNKSDGGFDADGKLLYDEESGKSFYLFYYRNQIIESDHDLNLVAKMKTIDTISKAQIKITVLKDGIKKMIAPPTMVNKEMIIYKGLIFNKSNLIGQHESKDSWNQNAVVDIYTTSPAGYWGSIYIQNRGKKAMSQMLMSDRYFYILTGSEMVRYRCAQTLTKNFVTRGKPKTCTKSRHQ